MGHFGCAGLKRQLRAHFHFPLLDILAENEIKHCHYCNLYTTKAIKEPLVPVYVPSKAWEYVSIDFFGPMPRGEHVLVIQDLCTKYPVTVLIERNTSAKVTIEAIDKIFTNFGRPTRYRSDNGPPFNSYEFISYMKAMGIECDPSFPYRPKANTVETWMKPLGKCIKIASYKRSDKEKAIHDLLTAYRTTPHPATGLSPGEMLFRRAYPNRVVSTDSDFNNAVSKMKKDKSNRCDEINISVKRQPHQFKVGQWVYVKSKRRTKFEPLFHKDPWIIASVTKTGVTIHNQQISQTKIRHVDDIKPYFPQECCEPTCDTQLGHGRNI